MIKIIIFTNKYGYKSARLVADLGYRDIVLSWDINVCAELLRISVAELLDNLDGTTLVVGA